MNEQTNDRPRIEPRATAVVYEPNTGDIVAYHHFAAEPGAEIPGRKDMEDIALRAEAAASGTISPGALAILFVEPGEIARGATYRVSEGRQLIATREEAADPPSARTETGDSH